MEDRKVRRWEPLAMVAFWLLVLGALYAVMHQYLKPKPVTFMVDTGASLLTVSAPFAHNAGLGAGAPTVFKTVRPPTAICKDA